MANSDGGEGSDAGRMDGDGGTIPGDLVTVAHLVDHSDALPTSGDHSTTDVQMVDLNGDGRLDIVWVSQDWPSASDVQLPGALEISINDGDGKFHAADLSGTYLDEGSWQFVQPIDVDNDGDKDLLLSRAARAKSELLLLLNDGAGNLTYQPDFVFPPIEGNYDGLLFGRVTPIDADQDGLVDLFIPIFSNQDMTIDLPSILLMNQGMGRFAKDDTQRLPAIPQGQGFVLSAAAGDVNGDGKPDLFLGAAERRQRLLINDGTGKFLDQTEDDGAMVPRLPTQVLRAYRSEMVDLNGDGKLDIVVINDAGTTGGTVTPRQNQAFLNDGTGHFSLGWMAPGMTAYDSRGLGFGDLNHDGILDVVVGNATQTLSNAGHAIQAALGTGGGQFAVLDGMGPWRSGVFGIAMGDLNGDGLADVAGAVAEPDPTTGSFRNILLLSDGTK